MRKFLLIALFALFFQGIYGQEKREWETYLNEIIELDNENEYVYDDVYTNLCYIEDNPYNINTIEKEELEQLGFLSFKQIEDVCEFVYKYKPLKTLSELGMIESLGYNERMLLKHFVYLGKDEKRRFPSVKNIVRHGKHSVGYYAKVPLYDRQGDKEGYAGYKLKHTLRYSFNYGDYVKFGLVGANDSGEPFMSRSNKAGFDFYSFYFAIKNLGLIKNLVVGRYRTKLGLGLVMNSNFSLGKHSFLNNIYNSAPKINPYTSRTEANYMQGAAITMGVLKPLDLSVFVSYKQIDAILNNDSTIRSIITTGFHRTKTEIARKNAATELVGGANLNLKMTGFNAGISAVYTMFNYDLKPNKTQLYRKYLPEGNNFFNLSANYGYINKSLNIQGETATNAFKSIATINAITYYPINNLNITAVQRFYSYKYQGIHAKSFGENSDVRNESGVYLGINYSITKHIKLLIYSDYAYFPFAKYQVNFPSYTVDNAVQATYNNKNITAFASYRYKIAQKNNQDKTSLINSHTHKSKLYFAYGQDKWRIKTQGDLTFSKYKANSFGYMITQDGAYAPIKQLMLHASFAYFNTQDYSSRIYKYETSMPYAFSLPMFYGEGIRYSLYAKGLINKHLKTFLRFSLTNYFDRNSISSGLQKINHSSMADIELQVQWKF